MTFEEEMKYLLNILKSGAIIAGILTIMWGFFIGVIGIGPDGRVPWDYRIWGIMMFIEGFLYCIPNNLLMHNSLIARAYLIVTIIPFVALLVLFISDIQLLLSEISLFLIWACIVLILGFAPASLWVVMKAKETSNKALHSTFLSEAAKNESER